MAGDQPLVLETAYFPLELVEGLDASILQRASIYDEIERRLGLRITRAYEAIRPTVLSRRVAALLQVRPGSAAFSIERTSRAGSRRVEWQDSLVRGDPLSVFGRPPASRHDRADIALESFMEEARRHHVALLRAQSCQGASGRIS